MKVPAGNVCGVGIDLVEIDRVRQGHAKHGEAFLQKIFTADELTLCRTQADPYPSLAARFAAKEALSKAFGTGLGAEFSLQSLSVLRGDQGEPLPVLDAQAQSLLAKSGATRVLISLTHTEHLAQAIVLLVRGE